MKQILTQTQITRQITMSNAQIPQTTFTHDVPHMCFGCTIQKLMAIFVAGLASRRCSRGSSGLWRSNFDVQHSMNFNPTENLSSDYYHPSGKLSRECDFRILYALHYEFPVRLEQFHKMGWSMTGMNHPAPPRLPVSATGRTSSLPFRTLSSRTKIMISADSSEGLSPRSRCTYLC